jgi:hypothetical protein
LRIAVLLETFLGSFVSPYLHQKIEIEKIKRGIVRFTKKVSILLELVLASLSLYEEALASDYRHCKAP